MQHGELHWLMIVSWGRKGAGGGPGAVDNGLSQCGVIFVWGVLLMALTDLCLSFVGCVQDAEVLDSTVSRSKANLGRKRGHRAPAIRPGATLGLSEMEGDSWMFQDSTGGINSGDRLHLGPGWCGCDVILIQLRVCWRDMVLVQCWQGSRMHSFVGEDVGVAVVCVPVWHDVNM